MLDCRCLGCYCARSIAYPVSFFGGEKYRPVAFGNVSRWSSEIETNCSEFEMNGISFLGGIRIKRK